MLRAAARQFVASTKPFIADKKGDGDDEENTPKRRVKMKILTAPSIAR
jgi:hypothetical protein